MNIKNEQPTTLCVIDGGCLVGFHIIKAALVGGYRVYSKLRHATDEHKTRYLNTLLGASDELSLFSADMSDEPELR